MAGRNHVKYVITKYRTNQTALQRLRDEKVVVEAELRDLKMAYSSLKGEVQKATLHLGSIEQRLYEALHEVTILRQTIMELHASKNVMCVELQTTKK